MNLSKLLKDGKKITILTDALLERLIDELKPIQDIRVYDAEGNRLEVKYGKTQIAILLNSIAGATTTAGGMIFRGLWAGGPAKYQEMWKVPTGSFSGTYVCVNPEGSASNPWQGVDWVKIADSNSTGPWN